MNSKERFRVDNPADIENPDLIKYWYEPISTCSIITPIEYVKSVKKLCNDRRAQLEKEEYINDGKVVTLQYAMPLAELIINFFDALKSVS